jgi:hypothetical protein
MAGQVQMSYSYSSYTNYAVDQNDIYKTSVLEGSATCYPTIPQVDLCPAVRHTGTVVTALGPVQATVGSNAVSPETYIEVTNAITLTNAGTAEYATSETERVICTLGGSVFLFQDLTGPLISIKWSAYQFAGMDGPFGQGECIWKPYPCTGTCTISPEWLGEPWTNSSGQPYCIQGPKKYMQCWDAQMNLFGVRKCVTGKGETSAPGLCILSAVPGTCN